MGDRGIFIRSLVGLDRENGQAGVQPVRHRHDRHRYRPLECIVRYLTENGVMDTAQLYELPFTDITQQGAGGVVGACQGDEDIQVLDEILERVVA